MGVEELASSMAPVAVTVAVAILNEVNLPSVGITVNFACHLYEGHKTPQGSRNGGLGGGTGIIDYTVAVH